MNQMNYMSWQKGITEGAKQALSDNIESYGGISIASNNRSFLDIEPNISVRDEYTQDHYYRFRPGENPHGSSKFVIGKSCRAYKKVGLVKNVIDLMGDFGSQGISLNHTNKRVEKFCRKWWKVIRGAERSERFLNNLYRTGNVIVFRIENTIKTAGKDFLDAKGKKIPSRYVLLNPLNVEVDGTYSDIFAGNLRYKLNLSQAVIDSFHAGDHRQQLNKSNLPAYMSEALNKKQNFVILPEDEISVFFYKKDDWEVWASPMIEPILDDITMLEKMKLADMSALDGAISNIRLWNIGSLEHKIMPLKGAIDKLRNILASHTGGGTMDLVWGPELSFSESNTQIYKFLGNEKYGPVLNSIYGGLGVPQSLTGTTSNTGFTNNFVSLKTLIERLEYGRCILSSFWEAELQRLADTMGFDPPTIHYDHIILSDEAAEKNLLIQLADRNIISDETLRERLGEDNKIETSRVKKQHSKYKKHTYPSKAGQYHNGSIEHEYVKLGLQQGAIDFAEVVEQKTQPIPTEGNGLTPGKKNPKDNGRPKFKKDTTPRKQRRVLPKSKAELSDLMVWTTSAQKGIAEVINPIYLASLNKRNLRELNKEELEKLELIKFHILSSIKPYSCVSKDTINEALNTEPEPICANSFVKSFMVKNERQPTIDELRNIYAMAYSLFFV